MTALRSRWPVLLSSLLLLALVTLPYLAAARAGGTQAVFGGFLLNPLDGNSYLAKMYAGWRGDWLFTLPYTAEAGQGHLLFIFYLFLGHLARSLGLSLVFTFHLARLMAAAALLFALDRFVKAAEPDRRAANLAFSLAALGSGLGWLALAFGGFPSDLWVAEIYPFLSAYANPHFPFGLAIMLWLLAPDNERDAARSRNKDVARRDWPHFFLAFLAAVVLTAVSPFGVVIVLVVLGILLLVKIVEARSSDSIEGSTALGSRPPQAGPGTLTTRFLAVLSGGLPLLLYDLWIARTDPLLAGWNAQNLTPAPPLWDLFLSLSPALLLAVPGAWRVFKSGTGQGRNLLAWAAAGLLLVFLPFGLQRRFLIGLYVPLAGLAALGLGRLSGQPDPRNGRSARYHVLVVIVFLLALPTNLIVLFAARHGVQTLNPKLYLSSGERQAFLWLAENSAPEAVILAAPETGLFIPAYTGRRVIYGHPFETVDAAREEAAVRQFFTTGHWSASLEGRRIDYLFAGPRERQLNPHLAFPGLTAIYSAEGVSLYVFEFSALARDR